ncbi:MAG: glycosyltransferase family 4 protein [Chloroflexi bacterium]|nr:glycosyltransferase family 4 protein [Chloroflexota bacterium]
MPIPLKVLHVNDVASVGANLVAGLQKVGVKAELYQPTVRNFRNRSASRLTLPLVRTREAFALRRKVYTEQVDLLHVHYASLAYLALIAGLPFLLHCHGSDLRLDLHKPVLRQLTLLALRRARMVFYPTPDLKSLVAPYRPDAIFLPNPVNTTDFSPADNPSPNLLPLFSISRLDGVKGAENLVHAMTLIWQQAPETQIAMFEHGDSYAQYGSWMDANRHRIILIGKTPYNEMPLVINQYQVILGQQNYRVSALGMSELEAMACAKPVVCAFAYPNAYPEAPPVYASPSPEAAAQFVLDLLSDQTLINQSGLNSRQWVTTYHRQETVAATLLAHYRAL